MMARCCWLACFDRRKLEVLRIRKKICEKPTITLQCAAKKSFIVITDATVIDNLHSYKAKVKYTRIIMRIQRNVLEQEDNNTMAALYTSLGYGAIANISSHARFLGSRGRGDNGGGKGGMESSIKEGSGVLADADGDWSWALFDIESSRLDAVRNGDGHETSNEWIESLCNDCVEGWTWYLLR